MKLQLLTLLLYHLVGAFILDSLPGDNGTAPAVIIRNLDRHDHDHDRETERERRERHEREELERCIDHCKHRHLRWY
jgi:hypothetical protein